MCVCVCVCVSVCVSVCVCLCVNALRLVSMDTIFRFTNTFSSSNSSSSSSSSSRIIIINTVPTKLPADVTVMCPNQGTVLEKLVMKTVQHKLMQT